MPSQNYVFVFFLAGDRNFAAAAALASCFALPLQRSRPCNISTSTVSSRYGICNKISGKHLHLSKEPLCGCEVSNKHFAQLARQQESPEWICSQWKSECLPLGASSSGRSTGAAWPRGPRPASMAA